MQGVLGGHEFWAVSGSGLRVLFHAIYTLNPKPFGGLRAGSGCPRMVVTQTREAGIQHFSPPNLKPSWIWMIYRV